MTTVDLLYREALTLPEEERWRLATLLFGEPPPVGPRDDGEWAKRVAEVSAAANGTHEKSIVDLEADYARMKQDRG
ncbi:MAG TPA: hypothetical protein PJ994_05560 [Tepidiformaceae bacterium]|nr:hypothetical protein [Tepidiformaceae bacterium]